jgi:hypothetical protein
MSSPRFVAHSTPTQCRAGRGLPDRDRERWRFLAEASVVLADADDLESVIAAAFRVAVPRFADVCSIQLTGDAPNERPRVAHARPELMSAMARLVRASDDGDLGPSTSITVPLSHRGEMLGTISFVMSADSQRRYRPADVELASDLAHRIAAAVGVAQQRERLVRALIAARASAAVG